MKYTIKDLPKSLKEIRVEFPAADLKPQMEEAAVRLSQQTKIEGFRPGKATYEVMVGRFGEGPILEEALPSIVRKSLVEAITTEKIETIGEPSINVEKAAPGNDIVFTATVAILPKVKKLPDLDKVKIEAKSTEITDEEVDKVLNDLKKMQKTEKSVEREAQKGDKITVNMDMTLDKVLVEGGSVKDHHIYLDEDYFIPGLKEKVLGMKKGETREFQLEFPKEHFQKNLAGKKVDFKVVLNEVNELTEPELNDEFAKTVGKDSLKELKDILRQNLEKEALDKEKQRQEIAAMEKLIENAEFDEIPDMLVTSQAQQMLQEFQHSIERQGMTFDDYLASIGKKKTDLLLDFTPDALKRAKSSILVRAIAEQEKIEPSDAELLEEQTKMLNMYKDDPETQERVRSEDGVRYILIVLRNRKVMEFIREKLVK